MYKISQNGLKMVWIDKKANIGNREYLKKEKIIKNSIKNGWSTFWPGVCQSGLESIFFTILLKPFFCQIFYCLESMEC